MILSIFSGQNFSGDGNTNASPSSGFIFNMYGDRARSHREPCLPPRIAYITFSLFGQLLSRPRHSTFRPPRKRGGHDRGTLTFLP